jgi:hypothetical protein
MMRCLGFGLLTLSTASVSADLSTASVSADPPGTVAQKLVTFAHDACGYMQAHPAAKRDWEHPAPEPHLASHFGRVLKKSPIDDFGLRRYILAVPQFPGWAVEFRQRRFVMTIPAAQQPLLQELTRLLGTPREQIPDHLAPTKWSGVEQETGSDWIFTQPAGWPYCHMEIFTEWHFPPGQGRVERVTTFELSGDR